MKVLRILTVSILFVLVSAMTVHRFYVGIYQIDFLPKKKEVQITTRIFVDDLNEALKKAYHKKAFIGTEKETPEDITLMKKYITEKFKLTVNGQSKTMLYLSNELENNVIICYLKIKDINKVTTLGVENSILTEIYADQQNIIQYNNNGKKQNLLLNSKTTNGMLK